MKLYVNHFGQWAGNQDDARSYGHPFDQVEVPYDKKGLLEFLNENKVTVGLPDNVPQPLRFKASHGPDGDLRLNKVDNFDPERIPSQKPNYVDPIIVTSGNTKSTPLAYVKDKVGILEIENVYQNLVTAHLAMTHIMEAVGHTPHKTTLFKEEEE